MWTYDVLWIAHLRTFTFTTLTLAWTLMEQEQPHLQIQRYMATKSVYAHRAPACWLLNQPQLQPMGLQFQSQVSIQRSVNQPSHCTTEPVLLLICLRETISGTMLKFQNLTAVLIHNPWGSMCGIRPFNQPR